MAALDEATVGDDPVAFFTRWFIEAQKAEISEVNAMTLATVGPDNVPHARIVLLKGLENGEFIFFTNYHSSKGKDISHNPNTCLMFFWKELERQVRILGVAKPIAPEQSDAYFHSRPEGGQIGAWASPQSEIIADRKVLDERYVQYQQQFADGQIPRPEHWGGYAVTPTSIEFWQGRASRLHDRIVFVKGEDRLWKKIRLAP